MDDFRAKRDRGAPPDLDATAEHRTGRDAGEIFDDAIVIDRTAGIQYAMRADTHAGIEQRARHHDAACTDMHTPQTLHTGVDQ